MLPTVSVTKPQFSSVSAPPSNVGILAILACSSTGTVNTPGSYADSSLVAAADGYGPLPEYSSYTISQAGKPIVAVKGISSYAGRVVSTDITGVTGTAVPSFTGAPYDHYGPLLVTIVNGGALGTAGITWTYSLDGGGNTSGVQNLGTALSAAIPNTGLTVVFGTNAQTLATGDFVKVYTERPLLNDTDTITALTALQRTRLPWEGALIDCSATSGTVGLLDGALSTLEAKGQFKFFLINTRFKNEPLPTAETEADYASSLGTMFGNAVSPRGCVCADGAHVPSLITGANTKRPTSMLLGARAMAIDPGTDPAYVATGALAGAQIGDGNGNPFDHDEDLFPNLDSLRLTTLRAFSPGGPQGVYITNANVIQANGGSYPYLQYVRVANALAGVCWYILTTQLSVGVRKNPQKDPSTGLVYIFEPDASRIEAMVNEALAQPAKGQCSAFNFSLSRTDDMNANPCVINGRLSIVMFAYVKGFKTQVTIDKTITIAT